MPPVFPPFQPRAPWLGPDLQTLRNALRPPRIGATLAGGERLVLPLGDGSGDRLAAMLHRPASAAQRPLVVLVHGLSGTEDSVYMLVSAAGLLAQGYPVLRLNLRGAGPSRPLCRLQYHAGRSEDLRDALAALDPRLAASGLFLVGYSLGGNMLLKFLAEHGTAFPVRAAVAVSAPIDLAAASTRISAPRNRVYHRYLLRYMQAEALAAAAALTAAERERIGAARSIYEFDDRFMAPRNGFRDADEYYAINSGARFLAAIRVPTLIVHALDDPWIPPDAYLRHPWTDTPHLLPLLVPGGGHVGFHGRGSRVPWHDQCVARFFANGPAVNA